MSKHDPLFKWLQSKPAETFTASFAEIEAAIGFNLPASARYKEGHFWESQPRDVTHHPQCVAWQDAGFRVLEDDVDYRKETVQFVRRDAPKA